MLTLIQLCIKAVAKALNNDAESLNGEAVLFPLTLQTLDITLLVHLFFLANSTTAFLYSQLYFLGLGRENSLQFEALKVYNMLELSV